jgi:hypothetical protein
MWRLGKGSVATGFATDPRRTCVRKIIIGGATLGLATGALFATGAFAGGNGADRSGLSPQGGDVTGGQCQQGSGEGGNGFVILNAPGPPGNASKLLGEVSLKNATPNTTYMVAVSVGQNNCMPEGSITTNEQGNGNAHIADSSLANGSYYVVITDASGNEVYASGPLAVN